MRSSPHKNFPEVTLTSESQTVKVGQVRLLYEPLPLSLLTVCLIAAVLAGVQWEVVRHDNIVLWLTIICVITALRAISYLAYRHSSNPDSELWYAQALLGALVSGTAWGSAGLLMFPADAVSHQSFLALVIAGVAAGGVTTLSARVEVAMAHLLPTTLPFIIYFLVQDTGLANATAYLILLFAAVLAMISRRLAASIETMLTAQYRNQVAEETVRRQALYDELTGLANRRMLSEHLNLALSRCRREGVRGGILFLDLDRFKYINDSLGHHVGDELLQVVAERIKYRVRQEDTVARIGGDEFVVLLPNVARSESRCADRLYAIAHDIREILREPFDAGGHTLHLDISVGIADFGSTEQFPTEMLRRADMALHAAKAGGRGTVQFFQPEMQVIADRRLACERGLRQALELNELELYYQVQVDSEGDPTGAEALIRWHHPDLGMIAPDRFIPIAEDTGLILPIGDWVLKQACAHLAELGSSVMIAVNVGPRQFRDPNFAQRVQEAIETHRVDPNMLQLEITEGTIMDDVDQSMAKVDALKALGVSLALDDFGTGYSSLAYLKQLPVDLIKISHYFVTDITSDPSDARIVEAIIALATHMGVAVIAEGVETEEVARFLNLRGCPHFQGFLFGRPEPFAALMQRVLGHNVIPFSGREVAQQ
jgi:diguanylate cyclase (GGDEF)-like protein